MVAIGIERILELGWTAIGNSRLGAYWPMKQIDEAVKTVEDQTDALLGSAIKEAREALEAGKSGLADGSATLKTISDNLAELRVVEVKLRAKLDNARQLAPGSSRLALVSNVAAQGQQAIDKATTVGDTVLADGQRIAKAAAQSMDLALELVSSFQDNPAKRVMSILVGAALGMLVASLMGLNIFLAVLDSKAALMAGTLGVLVTGVVMGLGSAPTHEIIKGLQRYKESRGGSTVVASPMAAGEGSPVDGLIGVRRSMVNADLAEGSGMDRQPSPRYVVIKSTD
jgi:hypothetical protein